MLKVENPAFRISVLKYSEKYVYSNEVYRLYVYVLSMDDTPVYIIRYNDSDYLLSTGSEIEAISSIEDWWETHKPDTELHSTFSTGNYREYQDESGINEVILGLSGDLHEGYLPRVLRGGQ